VFSDDTVLKPVPVMVTMVSNGPLLGEIVLMEKAGAGGLVPPSFFDFLQLHKRVSSSTAVDR
jgi:hypothetical protein